MSTAAVVLGQMRVEFVLAARRFGEALNPLVFFAATVALFPLGLGPEPERMAGYAAGVLWVAALLAALYAQARQFRAEAYSGALEQMVLSPHPLWLLLGAKLLAQWLLLTVPLLLLTPLCAYALHLPGQGIATLLAALALATPTMVVLGAIGAALTVHANQGGALLTVLVMPLLVPVLIFGARATDYAARGQTPDGALLWLSAVAVVSVTLGPFALSVAVRTNIE